VATELKASGSRLGFMKFYPGDWFGDNITLSHEEFGVYTRMMCRYWMRDGIPWSLEAIAEEIGDRGTEHIETIQKVLDKKFTDLTPFFVRFGV
jgi:uncharacterized protein YdaU (DUF1376 family)